MFSMYQILCVVLGEGNCSLFKTHMLNQARNVTTDCRESDTKRSLSVGRVFGVLWDVWRGGGRQMIGVYPEDSLVGF